MKRASLVLKIALILFLITFITSYKQVNCYHSDTIENIRQYINLQIKNSKIPGLSVAVVNGEETLLQAGFGVQDLKLNTPVTDKTVFELGSNSKAFTALAILNLHYKGKIDIENDIKNYIPWLAFYYDDAEVRVNVESFMYHTSGVPASTIYDIPVSSDKKAIENTVKAMDKNLDYMPYEKCVYATINYNILGLLIEEVTLMSYEEYIQQNILVPLGLSNTYLYKEEVSANLTPGYKLRFFEPAKYDAPEYKGNKPAGYIMSSASDISKWLKWQLTYEKSDSRFSTLFHKAHQIKSDQVSLVDNLFYAGGWIIDKDKDLILHSGSNPNFSSFIAIDPNKKVGISVLANMKSSDTTHIALGILDILNGKKPAGYSSDFNQLIDKLASILIIIFIILLALLMLINLKLAKKIRKISDIKITSPILIRITLSSLTAIISIYCLVQLPLIFGMKNWDFIRVWYPQTAMFAVMLLAANTIGVSILFMLLGFTRSKSKITNSNK